MLKHTLVLGLTLFLTAQSAPSFSAGQYKHSIHPASSSPISIKGFSPAPLNSASNASPPRMPIPQAGSPQMRTSFASNIPTSNNKWTMNGDDSFDYPKSSTPPIDIPRSPVRASSPDAILSSTPVSSPGKPGFVPPHLLRTSGNSVDVGSSGTSVFGTSPVDPKKRRVNWF